LAQNLPPEPSFEVADLKVNNSGAKESSGDISNGRLTTRNATLRFLIAESWSLTVEDVSGPSSLDDVRVDIVAKAAFCLPAHHHGGFRPRFTEGQGADTSTRA